VLRDDEFIKFDFSRRFGLKLINSMVIENIKVRLLRANKLQGIDKGGKPYMFYVANVIDEDANVLKINLSNALSNDSGLAQKLEELKDKIVTISLALRQSGFNLKGTIVKLDTRG